MSIPAGCVSLLVVCSTYQSTPPPPPTQTSLPIGALTARANPVWAAIGTTRDGGREILQAAVCGLLTPLTLFGLQLEQPETAVVRNNQRRCSCGTTKDGVCEILHAAVCGLRSAVCGLRPAYSNYLAGWSSSIQSFSGRASGEASSGSVGSCSAMALSVKRSLASCSVKRPVMKLVPMGYSSGCQMVW